VRKRGKQRALRALVNPLNYVLDSITPLVEYNPKLLDLKIKNHASMLALTEGRATRDDYNRLIALANIVEALYLMGFGKTYKDVMDQGHEALLAVGRRSNGTGRYILKAGEVAAARHHNRQGYGASDQARREGTIRRPYNTYQGNET
jgi:hypothetical protein